MDGKKFRISKKSIIFLTICIILFIILALASLPLKTVNYEFLSDKVSSDFRIVQISDLHSCRYGEDMSELKDRLDDAAPDIVVFTGDIYDDVLDNGNTAEFMNYAAEHYKCLYVAGNHELRSGKWDEYAEEAREYGAEVMTADYYECQDIVFFGVETPQMIGTALYLYDTEHESDEAENYNILLSHYPEEFELYDSFGRFDLVLCGHAHGGQWRLPFFQNGLFAPGQGLFPKYSGGRFESDNMAMIVSRGLTRTKEPIPRIFNNPEFVIIDILPDTK